MGGVETTFWNFSLRVYDAPGVSEACLWLQDERGLDVNLLLFCVWAGHGRGELQVDSMEEAGALAEEWSTRVLRGLRTARRGLAGTGYDELHAHVQQAELAAEKIVQGRLERLVVDLPPLEQSPAAACRAARRNLELYLGRVQVGIDAEVAARLAKLIDAPS